jgi:isocitrate dehydrogenase
MFTNIKHRKQNMENGIISYSDKKLIVPDRPVILYIEGDGIGPELWNSTRPVLDAAVHKAYNSTREIEWKEAMAGGKLLKRAVITSLLKPLQ